MKLYEKQFLPHKFSLHDGHDGIASRRAGAEMTPPYTCKTVKIVSLNQSVTRSYNHYLSVPLNYEVITEEPLRRWTV